MHLDGTAKADFGSKMIGYISRFYIWMIVGVIGGMVLHNLIIFRKKLICTASVSRASCSA